MYFPLALPSILAGLRITTVMLVALTGLATLIGAGGLGQAIFRGLNTMNTPMIIAGSLLISLLAILGDRFVGTFENKMVRVVSKIASARQKLHLYINLALLALVLVFATVRTNPFAAKATKSVTVASKPTGEQFILGEIMAQLIESETDLQVIRKFGIGGGTTNIHPALMNDEVDMYVEYTGTGWMNVLKQTLPGNKQVSFNDLQKQYEEEFQLKWLGLLGFNNTYALAIPDSLAQKFNINSCSELAQNSTHFRFGAEFDFFERPDGYQGLVETYGFRFASIHEMDINLRYKAIVQGKVNAIDAFTTDAKIVAQNLRVLADDLNYFPSYEAGIIISMKTLKAFPELEPLLSQLNGLITTATMMQMNYEVEIENKDPKTVAQAFVNQLTKHKMSTANIIHFENVSFAYGQQQVLHRLNFSVEKGEFICLTGKSGCGKSTLLRLINGLLPRQNGNIAILGKSVNHWEVHEMRRRMGYVLQEGALFPHLTAYQNMCYAMRLNKYTAAECEKRINQLLPLVNLDPTVLHKFPDALSGGQRQRVGIVRAIAHEPEMVFMDEPFSALDEHTRENLQQLVKNIHRQLNTTFVMVTHSSSETQKLATRIIHMQNGQIQTQR